MSVESLAESHREGLRDAAADVTIFRWIPWPGDFDRWFDEALAVQDQVPFAVVLGGQPVGSTRYLAYAPEHRRVEIGWTWTRREAWRTGANVETKYLLLENAFDRWGAMRVEFKTDARNLRVRGALLGVGGRFEGIFRKHMKLPDSIRDSAWYAIVDDDWPQVKPMLQAKIAKHAA